MTFSDFIKFINLQSPCCYLLRPAYLDNNLNQDVDLYISEDFLALLSYLELVQNVVIHWRATNDPNGFQFILNEDLVLDCKFHLGYLPGKIMFSEIQPTFSRFKVEGIMVVPDVPEDMLFAYWTLHLLLDKIHPSDSSTYKLYSERYLCDLRAMVESEYFLKVLKLTGPLATVLKQQDLNEILFVKRTHNIQRKIMLTDYSIAKRYYLRRIRNKMRRTFLTRKLKTLEEFTYTSK